MSLVLPPDLETFLIEHLRTRLQTLGHSVEVGPVEPEDLGLPLAMPMIVVRDDSGPIKSVISFDRQVGVSVLAGSKIDDSEAKQTARLAMAILTSDEIIDVEGSPVAAIDISACNGPYAVQDSLDVARQYFTVGYTAVGSW